MKRAVLIVSAVAAAGALAATAAAVLSPRTLYGSVDDQLELKFRASGSGPVRAGTYKLVVSDPTQYHNFHLIGKGVNVKTEINFRGKKTFTVKLTKGLYRFVCDPHSEFMKGSFRVT